MVWLIHDGIDHPVVCAGPSQEAEGESKPSRERDKGPHGHRDTKYLEERDTKYDKTRVYCSTLYTVDCTAVHVVSQV